MPARPTETKIGEETTVTRTRTDHDHGPRHRRRKLLDAPHIAQTAIESEIRNPATARIVLAAITAAAEAVIAMANPLVWGRPTVAREKTLRAGLPLHNDSTRSRPAALAKTEVVDVTAKNARTESAIMITNEKENGIEIETVTVTVTVTVTAKRKRIEIEIGTESASAKKTANDLAAIGPHHQMTATRRTAIHGVLNAVIIETRTTLTNAGP
jgi:hypothetical protein